MSTVLIWATAALLYLVFWSWYVGFRRRLTFAEIDARLGRITSAGVEPPAEQLATVRAFLQADDGREFFMVNLIRLQPEPVTASGDAPPQSALTVLARYSRPFLRALLLRAGHPVFYGRSAGGYVEQWGVGVNPGWTFAAVIRYRSRRDLLELVTDPSFAGIHRFKQVAIACTLAFPTAPGMMVTGPRVVVALGLGLIAALVQIALASA